MALLSSPPQSPQGNVSSVDDNGHTLKDRFHGLETSAVRISLWLGGVGLTCFKGIAYYLSGSGLVRAAMFESLGDVVSSGIMTLTQWRVADDSDRHLYPAGKQRLTPIGILVFCAFMTSQMVSMAIESVSSLTESVASDDVRKVFGAF